MPIYTAHQRRKTSRNDQGPNYRNIL